MWTRALLKANAKDILRRSYWRVFLACLIVSLLCGGDFNLNYRFGADSAPSGLPEGAASIADSAGFPFSALVPLLLPIILGVGVFALLLLLAAVLCWGILVTPVIQVGQARYLTENRSGPASLGLLFSGFTRGYWNTVGVMFFMNLKVFLWSLLLIIPGIVKSYQYRFIPFLLAENPDLTADRAFEICTMMTDGEKWNIFVLDLSFFGWNLLGLLLFGVGVVFVDPYVKTTEAELYAAMRAKVIASGYVTEAELTGQS